MNKGKRRKKVNEKLLCILLALLLAAGPSGTAWAGEITDAASISGSSLEAAGPAEAQEGTDAGAEAVQGQMEDGSPIEAEPSTDGSTPLPEDADGGLDEMQIPAEGDSPAQADNSEDALESAENTTEELTDEGTEEAAEELPESELETAEESESTEEEEEPEEEKTPASEVGGAITELLGEAAEIAFCSEDELAGLQEKTAEVKAAYEELAPEEQAVLDGSIASLGNMEQAVSAMQDAYVSLDQTGAVAPIQSDLPNSWRFINGQPIEDALRTAEQETSAAEALELGEDEAIVNALKNGEIQVAEGDASVYEAGSQPEAILVSSTSYMKGVDVSEWQGTINWAKVKKAGIQYAILRAGYGDNYTEQDDKTWQANVAACEKLGIPYGVYLYSYATNVSGAKREAAHILRLLEGHTPSLPVYIDIEDNSQALLDSETLYQIATLWCDRVRDAGYNPGIYASLSWWNNKLAKAAENETFYHWIAQWPNKVTSSTMCSYAGRYEMWQYCSDGTVSGITGKVDMNRYYGNIPAPALKRTATCVRYRSHVYQKGWADFWKQDGQWSVTSDNTKMVDAIQVKIEGNDGLGIRYRCNRADIGWESWRKDGKTSGKNGVLANAFQMELTGEKASRYDLYYCVKVEKLGWLNWASNGQTAGTGYFDYEIKGIRIRIKKKGSAAPKPGGNITYAYNECDVIYRGYMQDTGWKNYVKEGELGGAQSGSKRLEAVRIKLQNQAYTGGITYQLRYKKTGWTKQWKKNGQTAGGKGCLTEAIQIKLTGKMASNYDVYYCTYVQSKGWTAWVKNGKASGSAGLGLKMLGIKVLILPKGSETPGSGGTAYYTKSNT